MIDSPTVRSFDLPAHAQIPEPSLRFHPTRPDDTCDHPLRGLDSFGPYSRPILGAVNDPIRIAVIGPWDCMPSIDDLFKELECAHEPKERRAYLVRFRGFSSVFGTRLVVSKVPQVLCGKSVDAEIVSSVAPHQVLAEHLARAINAVNIERSQFDVLLIYLPTRWAKCFSSAADGKDFDLHDFIKGHTASLGIPAQIIREDRALAYFCRCSVMWRLGIALYCKAGGIPWKLAHTASTDTMYVGLGFALKYDGQGNPKYLTTCSQVFDHDGTGLEFIAYETRDMIVERENPYLKRTDMHRVMARSLDLYQHRHSGKPPSAVVVHKFLPFKDEERDGCLDAFRAVENVELLQIQGDAMWRGAHIDKPQIKGVRGKPGYACMRGSYMLLDGNEALLWTQGNVPQGNKDFFKEMKGTPKPLLIRRFAGRGPFYQTCNAILGLTKMDWNNDALYDRLPVTQSFAAVLAQTLKRMPSLTNKPYQFRLFM